MLAKDVNTSTSKSDRQVRVASRQRGRLPQFRDTFV
jgi:hypothetical protein